MDEALRAINEFEDLRDQKDFDRLTTSQIISFQTHLKSRRSKTTGELLSATTISHILRHNREFFTWMMTEKKARRLTPGLLAYFTVDRRTRAASRTHQHRKYASHADWLRLIEAYPGQGLEAKRDRAILALLILTGVRDAALVSLRLKHLDLKTQRLDQYGREVDTKFGKSMWTRFFPYAEPALKVLTDYVETMISLGLAPEDPLFPQSLEGVALGLASGAIKLSCWQTASPIRRILKVACAHAGIPYVVPHSVRNTTATTATERCQSLHDLVAWGQNLGHKSVFTTLDHYAQLPPDEIDRIMEDMETRAAAPEIDHLADAVRGQMRTRRILSRGC